MKGMFAWTNPQLVFLFELFQAHCTYLKGSEGVRGTLSVKSHRTSLNLLAGVWTPVVFMDKMMIGEQTVQTAKVKWKKTKCGQHLQKI